jgi:hypothetical protein
MRPIHFLRRCDALSGAAARPVYASPSFVEQPVRLAARKTPRPMIRLVGARRAPNRPACLPLAYIHRRETKRHQHRSGVLPFDAELAEHYRDRPPGNGRNAWRSAADAGDPQGSPRRSPDLDRVSDHRQNLVRLQRGLRPATSFQNRSIRHDSLRFLRTVVAPFPYRVVIVVSVSSGEMLTVRSVRLSTRHRSRFTRPFAADRAFPASVRGPVAHSHGFTRRIEARSAARPAGVRR